MDSLKQNVMNLDCYKNQFHQIDAKMTQIDLCSKISIKIATHPQTIHQFDVSKTVKTEKDRVIRFRVISEGTLSHCSDTAPAGAYSCGRTGSHKPPSRRIATYLADSQHNWTGQADKISVSPVDASVYKDKNF